MEELEPNKEELIAELKEAARISAFYAVLLEQPEEIGDAIVLARPYSLCRKFAAHEFLIEIVKPAVAEGQRAAEAELERLRIEKEKIQKKQEQLSRVESDLAAEEQRLKQSASDFEQCKLEEQRRQEARAAEAGHAVAIAESRLKLLTEELEAKENRLGLVGCLEEERARVAGEEMRLEQEKNGLESWRAEEKARLKAEMEAELGSRRQALERECEVRQSQLNSHASRLAQREAGFRKRRVARFLVKLAAAVSCVLLVVPIVQQVVLGSFLSAREELAETEQAVAERDKNVADAELGLASREDSLGRREQAVQEAQAGLAQREEHVSAAEADLRQEASALSRRESELNSREERLTRREREARQTQSPAWQAPAEQASWPTSEKLLTVTLVDNEPQCVSAEVVFGGAPFRFNGPGSVKVSVKKGRYSYSVTALTRVRNGAGLLRWSGSGEVEVFRDGQQFSVVGRYPDLWLASD